MNLPYFAVQLTNISCMDEHEALQRMAAAAAFQHRPQDCALQERQDCEAISQTAGETAYPSGMLRDRRKYTASQRHVLVCLQQSN